MAGALTPIGALSYNGARWRVTDVTAGSPAVVTVDFNHAFQVGDLITLSGMIKRVVDADVTMIAPTTAEWRVTAVTAANKVTVNVEGQVSGAPLLGWLTYPGWLPALGQRLAGSLYPALRRRLMNQFGAGDASSYVLPNLAGHVYPVGLDLTYVRVRANVFSQAMNGAWSRGSTGGESSHLTLAAELPVHNHPANEATAPLRFPAQPVANLGTAYDGAGLAPGGYQGRVVAEYGDQIWLDNGTTSGTYTPAGNPSAFGEPHENRPPFREMFPLIFAGSFQ